MEPEIEPKKSIFYRWWFWVIIAIILAGVIVLILTAVSGMRSDRERMTKEGVMIGYFPNDEQTKPFSDEQLEKANSAIERGIFIDDPQNDFYIPPEVIVQQGKSKPDNIKPYPVAWTDLKSIALGADENYLYIKQQFWGEFPRETYYYNGDLISGAGAKISNFSFRRQDGKQDSADLGDGLWLAERDGENFKAGPPVLMHAASITPTGIGDDFEMHFQTESHAGMVAGGPGYDWIISAYPLSLFDIKIGDEVSFDAESESSSNKFHHEAQDLLLDQEGSKFGKLIVWTLGANIFKVLPNNPKNHS